jgi:carbamoyltransferase
LYILGVSAWYHDSAACLLQDGRIVAAAQEERFTRKKHDSDFPVNAIASCLEIAGIGPEDLDAIGYYDKPFLTFDRLLETCLHHAPRGLRLFQAAMPVWLTEKLFGRHHIRKAIGADIPIHFAEHHASHAASAFFPSPFTEAAILTVDGVGEWATTTFGAGRGNHFDLSSEIRFPHSLGLLYSAFTYYTGFRVNSGEYKLMGLAPYGEPKYADKIRDHLIRIYPDGSFRMNMDYFDYPAGLRMTGRRFHQLFDGPPRPPDSPVTQREMDLARSVQVVLEEVLLSMANHLHRETGMENLVMAGGVALNCVANGRILRESPFTNLWIQPAAGDAGGALGVALDVWHRRFGNPRTPAPNGSDSQQGSYLGPEFAPEEIERQLTGRGAAFRTMDGDEQIAGQTARLLESGKIVGWFQGRMEFGPRALGARSILGDPRDRGMQKRMNLSIKYRESFRPFAPSVLAEHSGRVFQDDFASPYMLLVTQVLEERRAAFEDGQEKLEGLDLLHVPKSDVPAITHVDYSARVQTVHRETNPLYHRMIERFRERTGCPLVINTSFNVRGEPIVCTPENALDCFFGTEMDALMIGPFLLLKEEQPAEALAGTGKREFAPD